MEEDNGEKMVEYYRGLFGFVKGRARGRAIARGGRARGRGISTDGGFGRGADRRDDELSIGEDRRRGFSVDAVPRRRLRVDLSSSSSSTSVSGPRALGASVGVVDRNDERMKERSVSELKSLLASHKSKLVKMLNTNPLKMGDPTVLVTEENRNASLEAKDRAMEAVLKGHLDEAIQHLDLAVHLNPTALMFCARASVYIKLNLPVSAAKNANAALMIDPNYAKGYKSRGKAHSMVGNWLEAANDLQLASKLDFDEETSELLKQVEQNIPNRAQAQAKKQELSSREPGGFPGAGLISGGLLGAGGMPDGFQGSGVMPGDFPGTGGTAGGSRRARGASRGSARVVPGNVDLCNMLKDTAPGDPED